MRIRSIIAIGLVLLPAVADAQLRMPRIGRRVGPPRNEPLPPQPPIIARAMAYKRLNYSVESYPLVAHFDASAFIGTTPYSWTSGGAGSHVDYRFSRYLSAAFDMTSSFLGGPAMTQTAELGTRIHPERNERKLYPFLDLRYGYMGTYRSSFRPYDVVDPYSPSTPVDGSGALSHGFGAVGGVGLEYAITRTISAVTSASVMQARMSNSSFRGTQIGPSRYTLTSYRSMLGLRWNPVRTIPNLTNMAAPGAE